MTKYSYLKVIENKIAKKQSISNNEINKLLEIIRSLHNSLHYYDKDDDVLKIDIQIARKAKELYEKAKKLN
ncbi:hypothetical protein JF110_001665 [Campylobacter jejuni]|nr:hypothetical protein [Campylobacter jejuni]